MNTHDPTNVSFLLLVFLFVLPMNHFHLNDHQSPHLKSFFPIFIPLMFLFPPSVRVSARSVPAPEPLSKGHPAPKYAAVTTSFLADSRERDRAPGNADPHPGTQQSPDCLDSGKQPRARGHGRD